MSMPLSIEWKLVTDGKEKRIQEQDNTFEIQFADFRLFPVDQLIEIRRHENSDQIGTGKIIEMTWNERGTHCRYQLHSLFNVN
ncbi:DUF2584 domain-containing protein [Radiobacillus kanasensis]|uniref:DUF2584 family protein n=1 Tax=Radiobacillus kanasensis TaxID=2844358 RepID=UPI001E427F8F|nr:DUF2584 family protein [Radiobacillus kanasensis]UFU01240.1 DUF2584 domain-containing protein [Radiobacillus kanasensis]